MALVTETAAESGLLLIDGLEIAPLPDALLAIDAADTSVQLGCCSCEWCSSNPDEPPPPPKECHLWTLFEM
jgi:hypothetical protein